MGTGSVLDRRELLVASDVLHLCLIWVGGGMAEGEGVDSGECRIGKPSCRRRRKMGLEDRTH